MRYPIHHDNYRDIVYILIFPFMNDSISDLILSFLFKDNSKYNIG